MTEQRPKEMPSDHVARRVKELRRGRDWTAKQLAAECARVGAPHLTESVIANIESGRPDLTGRRRRDVTVDEVLALASALDVAPSSLLPELAPATSVTPAVESALVELLAAMKLEDILAEVQRRDELRAEVAELRAEVQRRDELRQKKGPTDG